MRTSTVALIISLLALCAAAHAADPLKLTPISSWHGVTTSAPAPAADDHNKAFLWPTKMILSDLQVVAVAFSPDSKILAFSGGDPKIRIIQTGTWRELKPLVGHAGAVWDIDISPDGKSLVSGSDDGYARVWDLATGDQIALLHAAVAVSAVKFMPNGKQVLVADFGGALTLWDIDKEQKIRDIGSLPGEIRGISLSKDATRVAAGGEGPTAVVWDFDTGKVIASIQTSARLVSNVALSPDGKSLTTSGWESGAEFWDIDKATCFYRSSADNLTHRVIASTYAFSGKVCFLTGTESVYACEAATGVVRAQLTSWVTQFFRVAVSPDGRWVAASRGGHWPGQVDKDAQDPLDNQGASVDVWDLGAPPRVVHGGSVHALAANQSAKLLASAGEDGIVKLWSLPTLQPLQSLTTEGALHAVAISPNGRRILAGGTAGIAAVWSLDDPEPHAIKLAAPITSVAFATNDLAAVASGNTITLLDFSIGKTPSTAELRDHDAPVLCLSASPDGRHLVSGSADATIRIWDLLARKQERALPRPESDRVLSVAYSPDGKQILVVDPHYGPYTLDAQTGEPQMQFKLSHHTATAAWSPDGTLCSALTDSRGGVAIFKPGAGQALQSVGNGMWRIECALFVDDAHILCGTTGGQIALFPLESMSEDFPPEFVKSGVHISAVSADGFYGISSAPFDRPPTMPTSILWDLQKKTVVSRFDSGQIAALAADHQTLAAASPIMGKGFFTQDIATGAQKIFPLDSPPRKTELLTALAFSPTGKLLAAASQEIGQPPGSPRTVRVFDADTQRMLQKFSCNESDISVLAFSPDEKLLLTSSGSDVTQMGPNGEIEQDFTTRVLRLDDGTELKKFPAGARRVATLFSPDGKKFFLVNTEGLIVAYDAATFEEVGRMTTGRAIGAAISHDGKWILVVAPSGDSKLISTERLRQVGSIPHWDGAGMYPMPLFLADGRPAVWVNGSALRLLTGEVPQ
jgi:WD40 repeat protein